MQRMEFFGQFLFLASWDFMGGLKIWGRSHPLVNQHTDADTPFSLSWGPAVHIKTGA